MAHIIHVSQHDDAVSNDSIDDLSSYCMATPGPGADPGGGDPHDPPLLGTPKLHKEGKKRCACACEYTTF